MQNLLRRARVVLGQRRRHTTRQAAGLSISGAEILNPNQLTQHAHTIAVSHTVTANAGDVDLLERALDRDERLIGAAHRSLLDDARNGRSAMPAAEWLLDNFHLVVEQIREIRHDLPHGYYAELPKLTTGPLAGQPRVYAVARELISNTDSRIDLARILQFIQDYQTVTPLTMGELWAVAIMLRFGLVENLARISGLILAARATRDAADIWADRLLSEDVGANMALSPVLAELARGHPELSSAFAVRLLQRLRTYDGERDIGALVTWLEQQPIFPYHSIEALIHDAHQRQAAHQAAIGNTITSMRALNAIDWAHWFERVSLVEHTLRQDPAGAYSQSTLATRDHYRHVIERLARRSNMSELDIARRAVEHARRAARAGDVRASHVGYSLIDAGSTAFELELNYRPTALQSVQRALRRHPSAWYLGALAAGTTAIVAGAYQALRSAPGRETPSTAVRVASLALLVLPASAIAKELVDRAVASILPPHTLPRLDLKAGIPAELRTIVVVPTLLLTPESVRGQLASLEVLALANDDPHLHFALLSDCADAPAAEMPDDADLLAIACIGIEQLNARYAPDRFFLLHRQRVWNPQQGCFMGWERKRGKLEEFDRLLTGASDTTFSQCVGDLDILPQIRYVITLDADTQLPRDAGRALIGTLAHPLNHAIIDPSTRRVVGGYGILQPRISITMPSALRSRFAQIFSGNVGIDPYTTAISDVYMDLFDEGMYAGKGIYDPHALRETLANRFPDNLLLSHDLIEGAYARAGLLSDVELLDNYPTTYASFVARQHRWVRGDWQIGAWLLPWTPSVQGIARNVLSPIARFKILDNLRRSLVPPALVALLASGWLNSRTRRQALLTTGYALLPYALPLILDLNGALIALARGPDRQLVFTVQIEQLRLGVIRFGLNVTFLPDHAISNIDAICRTLSRLLISKTNLLEWETAEAAQARLSGSWRALLGRMLPLIASGMVAAATRTQQLATTWPAALPVIADWLGAPAIAAWLDQPLFQPANALTADDELLLRQVARSTWAYFEQFVTADANFLAPDNVQETPSQLAALRTSPTNIGLQLLADLAAYDFGYIGVTELTERSERVFATMSQMQYERGHLLNWYDNRTLLPLLPAYISTVDSGNLAGALLTLRQGYLGLHERPLLGSHILLGLQDTFALARQQIPPEDIQARQIISTLDSILATQPTTSSEYKQMLETILEASHPLSGGTDESWVARLASQAKRLLCDHEIWLESEAGVCSLSASMRKRHIAIADQALELVLAMDFTFLYDDRRHVFAIGYNLTDGRLDGSFYDLLASESRLASFLAVAKGDVPQEHWFRLGRTLLESGVGPVLASWSGTMFEYLMPLLLMHTYPNTLLDNSYRTAVARQIQYGNEREVPWGISESAFNTRDPAMNYQYHAFGVPGLGLQRGLGDDLVVAPYATALALPIQPYDAMLNLRRLMTLGMRGRFGLYEAIDYTPERLRPGSQHAIIRSYMVHHQGMSLLAFANALHDGSMQRRFHAEALVQATETLLQERSVPAPTLLRSSETAKVKTIAIPTEATVRHVTTPNTATPYTHLLSNGTYTVMLTNAGSGYSACDGIAVTRWHSDPAQDNWGSFCYIRDVRSDVIWSTAYQPTRHEPHAYHVAFGLDKVTFKQQVAGIETSMEVSVSPEDNVEVRHIALTNLTSAPRELEVTSYAEIVLASAASDSAHPAFSNLFVETEFVPEHDALLASRRPRSAGAARMWALHVIAIRGHAGSITEYETDRSAFIGRGHTVVDPQALHAPLTQQVGAVLDPIFSLRRRLRIAPGGTAHITFTTGMAESRDQALRLVDRYRDPEAATRAMAMAWTDSQVELRHLNITAADAQRFQRLAASVLYQDILKRARPEVLIQNSRGQSSLWAFGISGDEPIVLVRIAVDADLSQLVQELLQAHQYWRLKRLTVDLVLVNEGPNGYLQTAHDQILGLVRSSGSSAWLNQRGGVFVLRADMLSDADDILLQTAARCVLSTDRGGLAQHLRRREPDAATAPVLPYRDNGAHSVALPMIELRHRTLFGGFHSKGSFVVDLLPGLVTPAPWSNVIANERFGFIVTERGGGYTWAGNSRENRLTPWSNDPVVDPVGEAIYLRDETNGLIWSPTPQPAGGTHIRVEHGFGITTFEQQRHAIYSVLHLSVSASDPVKIYRLQLKNTDRSARQLSITLYVEWVLGVSHEAMAPFIITERDEETGSLLAHNPYSPEFSGHVAFLSCSEAIASICADRVAFIGRNGDLTRPAALLEPTLNDRVGAGLDPCGAIQAHIRLEPGEERELIFILGQGVDRNEAQTLIARYSNPIEAAAAERESVAGWEQRLHQVQVETPRPELDLLLNGWLLYQTLACRIWARSAFYQSGGAYGFRDQLQDVMALVDIAPEIVRDQILRAAARQFVQGDVQHWWHPPTGRGVRTLFSDDYLWLAFVTNQYVTTTGDRAVLDEAVPFLEGRPLQPDEAEYYDLPTISSQHGSLYDHCVRAIDLALSRMGAHGLPLMGAGDWNDGMNRVGHAGRGESIWVGWFLHMNLEYTAAYADERGDALRADRYRAEATRLRIAIEQEGWDGAWYRRAYYDDGTPLGSASSEECQIDSIAQSWAVISGAADQTRATQALAAADARLVDSEAGLIKLFTPPFNQTSRDPGYIKGYVPGVRENGGQYTHAALWLIWAYAGLKHGSRAGELLDLINPIRHSQADPLRYIVEPYVISADVYAVAPHTGRGGWSWYTGSAGWMYRLGIEMILGLRRVANQLTITPCIPPDWPSYQAWYRYGATQYHIQVANPYAGTSAITKITIDGVVLPGNTIPLAEDGATHIVEITLERS